MAKKIVFVCTGNTCRSVMAQFILEKMLRDGSAREDYEIISRGTAASSAYKVPEVVRAALAADGIDVGNHASTQISAGDVEAADKIYVMERSHALMISALFGHDDKIELLGGEEEIPDPIGQGAEIYHATMKKIKNRLDAVKKRLAENGRQGKV